MAAKRCSSDLRQKANDRTAVARLKRLIACNFTPQDYVLTLTYNDQMLPRTPEQARDLYLKPFIRKLRKAMRDSTGQETRYIYVIEGLHGDKRLHHHIIVQEHQTLKQTTEEQWTHGYYSFERIGSRGYDGWARYLTKEPRKTGRRYVGDRMWTPSLGLKQPEVETYEVPDSYRYEPPPGVFITDNEDWATTWWSCQYISYYDPEIKQEDDNGQDQSRDRAGG